MKNRTKTTITIICIMLLLIATALLASCVKVPRTFEVVYLAHSGTIVVEGKEYDRFYRQNVEEGNDCVGITVVPYEGYLFRQWSDGVTTATRQDKNIQKDLEIYAEFDTNYNYMKVNYIADIGGAIEGFSQQSVMYGRDAQPVTAVADEGYKFAQWSDGVTDATRIDTNIIRDFEVTAQFELVERTYRLVYNHALGLNTIAEKEVPIKVGQVAEAKIPLPKSNYYTFVGWFLEKDFITQATDNKATPIVDDELFENQSTTLYAKWQVKDSFAEQTEVLPILLVFVEEVDAKLNDNSGKTHHVKHKLTPEEKEILEMIPPMLTKYMEEMFNGLLELQVDVYWTKEVVTTEYFSVGNGNNDIDARDIPEVVENCELQNYRSVVTAVNMNDYNQTIHGAGSAIGSFAYISAEMLIDSYRSDPNNLYYHWLFVYEAYLHEITHTLELIKREFTYHEIIDYCSDQGIFGLDVIRMYLLNQVEMDGRYVGLPFANWTGEVGVQLFFIVSTDFDYPNKQGGTVNGEVMFIQKLAYGGTITLTAEPMKGYVFVGWSDGLKDATRKEELNYWCKDLIAYFEKI